METFISKLDVTVCPSKVAGVLCLVREDPYEPHETEQWILTCSAHGKHHSEDFRFFLFNSYSFSLNQTGVHIYTEAAEKCFTVEHLGAQTMSDQYFHFIKLFFFFWHLLQHCFAQKQRFANGCSKQSPKQSTGIISYLNINK